MRKYLLKAISILISGLILTGCGQNPSVPDKPTENKSTVSVINKEDNNNIKKLISAYFEELYSRDLEIYEESNKTGVLPEFIKKYIAKITLETGNTNKEIPVHLPRRVEINRLTAYKYTLLKQTDESSLPCINADFVKNDQDYYLYRVTVDLMAKCIPSDAYLKGAIDESLSDFVKLQAKYNVYIIKENSEFRILKETEINTKNNNNNRLYNFNNDFITRLSYLNLDRSEDGKTYICKSDAEIYEKQKAVIADFFNNLLKLNSDSMKLIYDSYNFSNNNDFCRLLDKLGVLKDKKNNEILDIGSDYKNKIDINSFPIQSKINRLINYESMEILPHPAYSRNIKRYIVDFHAIVEDRKIVDAQQNKYNFDYYIDISEKSGKYRISGIKLNEFHLLKS